MSSRVQIAGRDVATCGCGLIPNLRMVHVAEIGDALQAHCEFCDMVAPPFPYPNDPHDNSAGVDGSLREWNRMRDLEAKIGRLGMAGE